MAFTEFPQPRLFIFVEPSIFQLLVLDWAITLDLSSAIVHIFLVDSFRWTRDFSRGASHTMSIEFPYFASIANIRMILLL